MRQVYLAPRRLWHRHWDRMARRRCARCRWRFWIRLDISDNLHLDYGFDFQSISYFDRINYVSPFVRATFDAGDARARARGIHIRRQSHGIAGARRPEGRRTGAGFGGAGS